MPIDVVMPRTSSSMTQGFVGKWLKNDGEKVEKGEPLALIEDEKASVELESPSAGIFYRRKPEGVAAKPDEIIGLIVRLGEEVPRIEVMTSPERKEKVAVPKKVEEIEMRLRVSPLARQLAEKHAVSLSKIEGTGPRGMITSNDVLSFVGHAPELAEEEIKEIIPLTGWRKVMADRVSHSKRTAAHITTIAEVDVSELINLRKEAHPLYDEEMKTHVTFTALVVRATGQALRNYPIVNSSLADGKIVIRKHCNIGVAMARESEGLIVPVIHHVEEKSLMEISQALEHLKEKALNKRLSPEDLREGTFTITNVGMLGVIMNTPIINPPESAILGVGAIVKRPVVIDDKIQIRSMMYLCLSYDHRVIDGMPAVLFLQKVKQLLENPRGLFRDERTSA